MRVGVTGKLVVKMNIPVAVRNATTHSPGYRRNKEGTHTQHNMVDPDID